MSVTLRKDRVAREHGRMRYEVEVDGAVVGYVARWTDESQWEAFRYDDPLAFDPGETFDTRECAVAMVTKDDTYCADAVERYERVLREIGS